MSKLIALTCAMLVLGFSLNSSLGDLKETDSETTNSTNSGAFSAIERKVSSLLKGRKSKSQQILNINFASHPDNDQFDGAIGGEGDFWNFIDYSVERKTEVRFADGTASDVEIRVSKNDGEWGIPGHTGVYHAYIYDNSRAVDLSVTIEYLPPGIYEGFVFAHGDAPDQNAAIEIQSGQTLLTGKATLNDGTWNFRNHDSEDGNQYVRYVFEVKSEQPVVITSKRDGSVYSMFNAIQLRRIQ